MMKFKHSFAWPSRYPTSPNTKTKVQGSIGSVYRHVKHHVGNGKGWVDPMCGKSVLCEIRNDIRKKGTSARFHMDALEFLKTIPSSSANGIVYDPPYNDRQGKMYTKEFISYSKVTYWSDIRKEISRILRPGGICVQLGWNSNRMPGCEFEAIYLFRHGSERNDTIMTVHKKK